MKNILIKFVSDFICWIIDLLRLSWQLGFSGTENLQKALQHHPQGSLIFVVWHENAMGSVLNHVGNPIFFLISRSKDGDLVDAIGRHLGFFSIRGSSSRGGQVARELLREVIEHGYSVAITIDGPRGPRHECKFGPIELAHATGAAILPVVGISQSPFVFKRSWDQHKFIWPFSKVVHRYGTPITIPASIPRKELSRYLEEVKNNLNATEQLARQDFARFAELDPTYPRWKNKMGSKSLDVFRINKYTQFSQFDLPILPLIFFLSLSVATSLFLPQISLSQDQPQVQPLDHLLKHQDLLISLPAQHTLLGTKERPSVPVKQHLKLLQKCLLNVRRTATYGVIYERTVDLAYAIPRIGHALKRWGSSIVFLTSYKGESPAYLYFPSIDERDTALKILNNYREKICHRSEDRSSAEYNSYSQLNNNNNDAGLGPLRKSDLQHSTPNRLTNLLATLEGPQAFITRYELGAKAKKTLYLQYLIFRADDVGLKVADLLIKKRSEGVDVRAIIDVLTALDPAQQPKKHIWRTLYLYNNLMAAGIRVWGFSCGLRFFRTKPIRLQNAGLVAQKMHQKAWIVDGSDVIMGGMNIAHEYFRLAGPGREDWRDQDVWLQGPIVQDIQRSFLRHDQRNALDFKYYYQDNGCFNPYDPITQQENYLRFKKNNTMPIPRLINKKFNRVRANIQAALEGNLSILGKAPTLTPVEEIRYLDNNPQNGHNYIEEAYLHLIQKAQKEIFISNAYFVPTPEIRRSLVAATQRGVLVKIITNAKSTNDVGLVTDLGRYLYFDLARFAPQNMQIYEWIGRHPSEPGSPGSTTTTATATAKRGMTHSKFMVVDGQEAIVGSHNLTSRSSLSDIENAVVWHNRATAHRLRQLFEEDLQLSQNIPFAKMPSFKCLHSKKKQLLFFMAKKFRFLILGDDVSKCGSGN